MKLYCPECKAVYEDVSLSHCPTDDAKLFMLEVAQEDPLLDAVIDGRFKIESKLGQGGMGAVYAGVQLSVGRRVAIKVLREELIDRELALERFYRESKIISELTHPNIVRLIDFGQDRERDLLYLVMELVDGMNMGDMLERGRFKVALALEVVYQVCGALTEPHARGVIHRDLKPDNLLVVPISDGTIQIKVLDFGIARALEGNSQLTATGMVCGTPQYMAPEQAQNQAIGPPTDLYALGVILYEMLSGAPPFHGQNSLQVMLQQIQRTPEPLAGMLPPGALPAEVEDLVHDMLAKTSESRPQTAREVRDRIDAVRRSYDLPPVRLGAGLERDEAFDAWMLPSLPKPQFAGAPGDTEALRRESGLERMPHRNTNEREFALSDTVGEAAAPLTEPLPAEQRVKIYSDRRRQPDTPQPGAQTYTPEPSPAPPEDRTESLQVRAAPADTSDGRLPRPTLPPTQADQGGSRTGLFAALGLVVFSIVAASIAVAAIALSDRDAPDGDPEVDPEIATTVDTTDPTPPEVDPVTPTPPEVDTPKVEPPRTDPDPKKTDEGTTPADVTTPADDEKDPPKKIRTPKKKDPPRKDPPKVEKDPVAEPPPEKDPDPLVVEKKDPPKVDPPKKDPPKPKKSDDLLDRIKSKNDDTTPSKKLKKLF